MTSMAGKSFKTEGRNFAVIIFESDNKASVVPIKWLSQNFRNCYWPDNAGPGLLFRLLANPNSLPKSTWKVDGVRVLGTYKTLQSAREAEEIALHTSTVESNSDDEVPTEGRTRNRRKNNKKINADDCDEELSDEALPLTTSAPLPEIGLFEASSYHTDGNSGNPPSSSPYIADPPGPAYIVQDKNIPEGQFEFYQFPNITTNWTSEEHAINSVLDSNTGGIQSELQPLTNIAIGSNSYVYAGTEQQTPSHIGSQFEELVLKKLAEIQITQERIVYMIGEHHLAPIEDFDSLPIPCESKEELKQLERFLENKTESAKLERFLASFAGAELKKVVKTILSKLITDHFSITVSFTGKGQNAELAFDLFAKLHRAVINSTRMNVAFKNSTESEINTIIRDWLRMAKDRSSGRQHKKKVQ